MLGMAGVVFVDELRQPQRASHAGGTSADDDDIGFHDRTLDILGAAYEKRSSGQVQRQGSSY